MNYRFFLLRIYIDRGGMCVSYELFSLIIKSSVRLLNDGDFSKQSRECSPNDAPFPNGFITILAFILLLNLKLC